MNSTIVSAPPAAFDTPLLALCSWEGEPLLDLIVPLLEAGDWVGRLKQTLLVYPRGTLAARRVLLVGLGKRADASADRLREAAAVAAQHARELGLTEFAIATPDGPLPDLVVGQALVEGAQLGVYRFTNFRTNLAAEQRHEVETLTLLAEHASEELAQGVQIGTAVAAGTALARDLANRPGNDLVPAGMGEAALALGQEFGFKVTVLDRAELTQHGFGGILAVGKGSANEPRFIVIEHGQQRPGEPTICLVGKGITFDTGGISIKPAERMDEMKTDMGGAAAVLGTMRAVGTLKLPMHIVGLVSSAENMPSSTAYKPGDIITTLSGTTVEVLNTDAEGRIVLADALFYAQRFQPSAIIDLATLTGAMVVALGVHASGMVSNSDEIAARLSRAGDETGERVWRMPHWPVYLEQTKSEIADLKNTGGRPGGGLTAAAFLSQFVGEYPWAHLDIAGTAYTDRPARSYGVKGATGVGVRLLMQFLLDWNHNR